MRKIYVGIALAMALASCTHEELVNSMSESKLNVTVESADELSRVGFEKGEDWAFFWHNGDEIWVNGGIMSTDDADKSKTATFTGYGIDTDKGYAVYPYAMAEGNVNGTQLTWNFPSTYTYDDVDADFFASAQSIPMYAGVDNGNASFRHLGAIVAFKFNDWKFTGEHIFTLTSSKKISGEFTVDLSGETPVFVAETESEDVVTITYNRPADATGTSVVFYVPIPTGTYDLTVKVTVDGATKFTKASSNKTVNRGDIVWAELGESVLVGDNKDVKVVSAVADITADILSTTEKDLAVKVEGEVTGSQTITIPASLGTNTTTFIFENVADDAEITITNETGGAYDGKVIIEIPEDETIPKVVANIPDGEVYLKQGSYPEVEVYSKENTTVIGEGVKVGKLVVKKGNVRVEKGGEVTEIENSTNGTLYITNAGGTLPTALPDNTVVVYEDTEHAVVLNGAYSTEKMDDMLGYANDVLGIADNLTLVLAEGEYGLSSALAGKNIVLEGADKEGTIIKVSNSCYFENSVITLKNLTYSVPTGLNYTEQDFAFIHHAKEFNLTNCIVDGRLRLNVYKAVIDGCQFDITTSSGFDGYSLYYYGKPNSEVTVSNSTFNTAGKAIVMYNEGSVAGYNLKVEGCTFISSNAETDKAAIQMHTEYGISGTLTIKESMATGFADINGGLWNELNNTTKVLTDNFVKTIDGVVQVQTAAGLNSAATAGATVVALAKGTYNATDIDIDGKTLTLKGIGEDVVLNVNQSNAVALGTFDGSDMTFENLTISTPGGNYKGFARMEGTYNKCTFENLYFTFQGKHVFNECAFNANEDEHCIWSYGADDVAFNNCEFNYADRCVNVYTEMGVAEGVLAFTKCKFSTSNELSKGAVKINSSSFTTSIEVDFEECTKPAYGEMVFISGWDSVNGSKATVTIDGSVTTAPQK